MAGRIANDTCDLAIVGAGAAGLAAAIFSARADPTLRILLLDGAKKPGAKILVSGGGRCNVTNVRVTEQDFWGGRSTIVRRVLRAWPVDATVAFFREVGVPLHEEEDGKLFPDSNRARDVLNALLSEAGRVGVELRADHRVTAITQSQPGFQIATTHGDVHANRIVLATGGQSLPKSGSDGSGFAIARALGHTIVQTTPALAPLVLPRDEPLHQQLSGVAQDVELAIWIHDAIAIRLRGALLWTHFGVSGPVVLNASRHWLRAQIEQRRVAITVNFAGGRLFEEVEAEWTRAAREHPRTSVQTTLAKSMPASVASAVANALAIDGNQSLAHFPRGDRRRLAHALVAWPLPIEGTRGYNFAEATAGGVALSEIDPSTMESRVVKGVYLVGEMLDVDGRIGGFNFQWAWCSGFVAGRAVARGAARA
ncbi:MAG TPA: NAD(P)/FAD-dependent oxidoreductase [Vicinamibacterales bacterium]|nr:NAD(P)/FAD-dependent oxidoreductase [Vicinamibacterales bacterium]